MYCNFYKLNEAVVYWKCFNFYNSFAEPSIYWTMLKGKNSIWVEASLIIALAPVHESPKAYSLGRHFGELSASFLM